MLTKQTEYEQTADLLKLIFQHYDQFDSRYKGLLPLRRVYVPKVIEAEEE